MFWTALALLLMVVLGGFISYYGDLQGRRWGKRRVSWFGLRPKYTAVLITSLTGGFIALMSIVTVLAVFPTVRAVVLHGERVIEENKQLNIRLAAERKTQGEHLKELTENVRNAKAEYQSRNQELTTRSRELLEAKKELETLKQALAPKQAEIARLEAKQADLQATLKREQADIRLKSLELQTLTGNNRRAAEINDGLAQQIGQKNQQITRLSTSRQDLEQENTSLQAAKDNMTRVIANMSKTQANLTRQQTDLNHANEVLLKENKRIRDENGDLETTNRDRKQELDRKQAELDRVTGQVEQAYSRLVGASQTFTENYHALRQGEITIRAGGELARHSIPAHLHLDAARKQIEALLEEASVTAQSLYKAGRGANNRAVRIVSKRFITSRNTEDIDETASVNALAENIADSDIPVLLVVNSLNNCVRGEQVLVDIQPIQIRRVFDKKEVVASRLINASQSLARVKEAIMDFLKADVRNAAVQAGSIPRVDPITGLKEIGVFDSIALNTLADHIKRLGSNVLLKAIATNEITSADPLDSAHLRFDTVRAEK